MTMTKDEFRHAAELGLGRALTAMRADPLRYRETLIEVLALRVQYRSDCIYDVELLSCLPEPETAVRQIYEAVLPELKKGNRNGHIPLLIAFGFWEELCTALQPQYEQNLRQLRSRLRDGIREGEYPACANRYWCSVFQLTHYRTDADRVRRILSDLADLYDYVGDGDVPIYLKATLLAVHMDKAEWSALLTEVASRHRNGRKLLENGTEEETHWPDPPKKIPDLTADDICSGQFFGQRYGDLLLSFAEADESTVRAVAQRALEEADPVRRYQLLSLFAYAAKGKNPPAFPFEPSVLIDLAERIRPENSSEAQEDFFVILDILRLIRHPLVREYGETLLRQFPVETPFVSDRPMSIRDCGMWIRYGANYSASDRAEFAAWLTGGSEYDQKTARIIFLNHIRKNTPDLPMELLENLYTHCYPNNRGALVNALLLRGELPDWMRQECLLDSNPAIRKMVQEGGA
ncbi:MAG: hypothetical protein IJD06_06880 [Clostridia bacterium]|nr:hypothetical protein [Clostridia bacterium]